jgi:hypothetical protein
MIPLVALPWDLGFWRADQCAQIHVLNEERALRLVDIHGNYDLLKRPYGDPRTAAEEAGRFGAECIQIMSQSKETRQ